jgi:rfaE bifunctional protein nucleotidyltransferase chain/domain
MKIIDKFMDELRLRHSVPLPFYQHRIMLATGCFDLLHRGHVELFEQAAERFPHYLLWVGLNSDAAIRGLVISGRKPEGRPINTYENRAYVIAALTMVDRVFEIDSTNMAETIRLIEPMAWIKGGDYTLSTLDKEEVKAAKDVGAEIVLIPTIGDHSTTKTLSKSHERMSVSSR